MNLTLHDCLRDFGRNYRRKDQYTVVCMAVLVLTSGSSSTSDGCDFVYVWIQPIINSRVIKEPCITFCGYRRDCCGSTTPK